MNVILPRSGGRGSQSLPIPKNHISFDPSSANVKDSLRDADKPAGSTAPLETKGQGSQKIRPLDDPMGWSQLPPDEPGAELSRDARVWKVYVGETDKWDAEIVHGWDKSLDVLLVFSALFSAVSTSFIIKSSEKLEQDPNDVSAVALLAISQALVAITNNSTANQGVTSPPGQSGGMNQPFIPSRNAVVVNTLWFLSLALSILASFLAMLAKDWCHSFTAHRTGHHRDQARRRQSKWSMIESWKMQELMLVLPALIQLSLLLFASGLCVYLWDLNSTAAIPVICVSGAALIFYVWSSITAAAIEHFPYTTIVSKVLGSQFIKARYKAMVSLASSLFYHAVPVMKVIVMALAYVSEIALFPVATVVWLVSSRKDSLIGFLYLMPSELWRLLESASSRTVLVLSQFRVWHRSCSWAKRIIGEKRFQLHDSSVTSYALSWLLEYCETPISLAITLQSIAGAQGIPIQPLIKHGATWQVVRQLMSSSSGPLEEVENDIYHRALEVLDNSLKTGVNSEANENAAGIHVLFRGFQEQQEKQIDVQIKTGGFPSMGTSSPANAALLTRGNFEALQKGKTTFSLSLKPLGGNDHNGKPSSAMETIGSIIKLIEDNNKCLDHLWGRSQGTASHNQLLHTVTLRYLVNAILLFGSVSKDPVFSSANNLVKVCVGCSIDLYDASNKISIWTSETGYKPEGDAIIMAAYTNIGLLTALAMCVLLSSPSQQHTDQPRSSLSINCHTTCIIDALTVRKLADLEYQAIFSWVTWSMIYSNPTHYDQSLESLYHSELDQCNVPGLLFFAKMHRWSLKYNRPKKFQDLVSTFIRVVDNICELREPSTSRSHILEWFPQPVYGVFLVVSSWAHSDKQQKICEELLLNCRVPLHSHFSALAARNFQTSVKEIDKNLSVISVLRDIYESKRSSTHSKRIAAIQLWLAHYYYQTHSATNSSLHQEYPDFTDRPTRQQLEGFIITNSSGLYSSRIIECILQSRRPLQPEDQALLDEVTRKLDEAKVSSRLRGGFFRGNDREGSAQSSQGANMAKPDHTAVTIQEDKQAPGNP